MPFFMKALEVWLVFYPALKKRISKYLFANILLKRLSKQQEQILQAAKSGYKIKVEHLGLTTEHFNKLANIRSKEIVIGKIDQDGFLLSFFGDIPGIPQVSEKDFMPRLRFEINLVAIDGYVGIKKNHKGNKLFFINELIALHLLGLAGCNVPALLNIDFENLSLTFSYIAGDVLREKLAEKGAVLRDCDVNNNPDFAALDSNGKRIKRIKEGKKVLYDVIDERFAEDVFEQFSIIHQAKFVYNGFKYGNIIIEKGSGKPFLIDFESSLYYPHLGENSFRILRDKSIEQFNLHFNKEKMTYKSIRKKSKEVNYKEIYSPVYLGSGIRFGNIWNMNAGYGRWNYILKDNLPDLSGKRILTLGANNSHNSIQMLRSGAKEVVGIELSQKNIAQGKFIKAAFEWADSKKYNFKYYHANMKDLPNMDLGKFDMVIALCSIYYLDDESIDRLSEYISTISDVFVLQCNHTKNIERTDPHTYVKATVKYTLNFLRKSGFTDNMVIAPVNYTRPLVIGRKQPKF